MEKDVTVTVSLRLKPEEADKFCSVMLPELQKQTRAFKGVEDSPHARCDKPTRRGFYLSTFSPQSRTLGHISSGANRPAISIF